MYALKGVGRVDQLSGARGAPPRAERGSDGFRWGVGRLPAGRGLASGWEQGPTRVSTDMRHSAVTVRDGVLHVFWTRVGDAPEPILHSTVSLDGEWATWTASDSVEVLRPERPWEGVDLPVEPSRRGAVDRPVP